MARIEELRALSSDLAKADPENREAFHALVGRVFALLSLKDEDFAHQFGMSRPSVTRWRNGSTAPHPAVRRQVFARLARRVREATSNEEKAAPAGGANFSGQVLAAKGSN